MSVPHALVGDDIARDCDVGLMAVLLEEKPLEDACPRQARRGQPGCRLRKMRQDCTGLGQDRAVVERHDGDLARRVTAQLAMRGRIVLCGAISMYNEKTRPPGPRNIFNLIIKRGRMEGFLVLDYLDRFMEAQIEMVGWLAEGKVKHAEHLVDGLERAPEALNLLFTGGNTGKVIVKL